MSLIRLGNTQKSANDDGLPRVEVKEGKIRLSMQAVLDMKATSGESFLDVAYDPKEEKAYIAVVPPAGEGERQMGRKLSSSRYLNSTVIADTLSKKGEHYKLELDDTTEDDGIEWIALAPTKAPEK